MNLQLLIDAYLSEIRRVNGDEYADLVELSYSRGWFYLKTPWRLGSQSPWRSDNHSKPLRRSKLAVMIETLKQRPTKGD